MPHTWHDLFPQEIKNFLEISIHMPHTWHDPKGELTDIWIEISIHMPHTWHDAPKPDYVPRGEFISIHMPHTWHDALPVRLLLPDWLFQSTCHIRGMTLYCAVLTACCQISIHMPHTWHDCGMAILKYRVEHFNPHATYVA